MKARAQGKVSIQVIVPPDATEQQILEAAANKVYSIFGQYSKKSAIAVTFESALAVVEEADIKAQQAAEQLALNAKAAQPKLTLVPEVVAKVEEEMRKVLESTALDSEEEEDDEEYAFGGAAAAEEVAEKEEVKDVSFDITEYEVEGVEAEDLDTYFNFLDELRDSGETNMFGARPYLQREYGLEKNIASKILSAWMKSFQFRHPKA